MGRGDFSNTGVSREILDFIHKENLSQFRTKLAHAADEDTRRVLQKMIDEEIALHASAKME